VNARRLVALSASVALLSLSTPGCTPGVASTLAQVANVVNDAGQVLQIAELAYQQYSRLANPPPEQQAQFQGLLSNAWRALNAANAGVRGSQSLSQHEYDAAFAEFRKAYAELHAFLVQQGITGAPSPEPGKVGAAGMADLPEPAALTFRVE
jgi:hypothetical protein